jgi:hypothetical protein
VMTNNQAFNNWGNVQKGNQGYTGHECLHVGLTLMQNPKGHMLKKSHSCRIWHSCRIQRVTARACSRGNDT